LLSTLQHKCLYQQAAGQYSAPVVLQSRATNPFVWERHPLLQPGQGSAAGSVCRVHCSLYASSRWAASVGTAGGAPPDASSSHLIDQPGRTTTSTARSHPLLHLCIHSLQPELGGLDRRGRRRAEHFRVAQDRMSRPARCDRLLSGQFGAAKCVCWAQGGPLGRHCPGAVIHLISVCVCVAG